MKGIVDTNVYLSRWPFRRLKYDETPALVDKLKSEGVAQAWTGTFDGLLHKDIASANERLAMECRKFGKGILVPFGSINLSLPNWEDDLRRCHEQHKMPGVRVQPNYHGYKVTDPIFKRFLEMATERGLLVQLAILMEDKRTQHRLLQIPAVDLMELPKVVHEIPKLRLQLLNSFQTLRGGELLLRLMAAGEVYFEISTLEGIGGVGNLISQVPTSRVLFGSYSPFFYFESAKLKMRESVLTETQSKAIFRENARKLIPAP